PQKIMLGFDTDVTGKILYNLISNAFKFTPQGGAVRIVLAAGAEEPAYADITVADTGVGIPADKLDKIFDPFVQLEGAQQHAGTGVGLSLTKELVALHKGTIHVSSTEGVETLFKVRLTNQEPISGDIAAPGHSQQPEPQSLSAAPVETTGSTDRPIVLIVEDNDDIRNYILDNLSDQYTVLPAANGTE